ncbi:hypothetical protein ACOMHN_011862 [Nucella lapillus]
MSMMRARVRGHRWVDHPAAAVMKARVPGQWVDCPAAVVMEAREQGRCWIYHPAVAVMEARVQGRHWVDRPSVGHTHHHASSSEALLNAVWCCSETKLLVCNLQENVGGMSGETRGRQLMKQRTQSALRTSGGTGTPCITLT